MKPNSQHAAAIGNEAPWGEVVAWCEEMFGPGSNGKGTSWTCEWIRLVFPAGRWPNPPTMKFWFRNQSDLVMFQLKWQ